MKGIICQWRGPLFEAKYELINAFSIELKLSKDSECMLRVMKLYFQIKMMRCNKSSGLFVL